MISSSAIAPVRAVLRRAAGTLLREAGVVCLNYHRIGDGTASLFDRSLWSATAEAFEEQVRWLRDHFDVISPRELAYVARVRRGRHALVTFDDGYQDNYTVAYPILRSQGVPATFFVATGFIDDRPVSWWDEIAWMVRNGRGATVALPSWLPAPVPYDEPDREQAVRALLRAYKRLPAHRAARFLDDVAEATGAGRCQAAGGPWMTWDMLREMRAGGMTIGGHTVRHPVLSQMPLEDQRAEIAGCARRLVEELGAPMRTFSYPVGKPDSFNADTRACLREVGVRTAFSYYGGSWRQNGWDPYDVPRTAIEQGTSFGEFRAEALSPWLARV